MGISFATVDIGSVFSGIGTLAKDIRVAVTGLDPVKQMEIQAKLLELESVAMNGQLEINKVEATNASVFVSGWRPFIGWICGTSLLYNYILMPFIDYFVGKGVLAMNDSELMTLLFGMLGLSAMRSFDKVKGVGK